MNELLITCTCKVLSNQVRPSCAYYTKPFVWLVTVNKDLYIYGTNDEGSVQ